MIVSASSRTDIPAFYTPWFMNRIREGYFDVRNPFDARSVSRIFMEQVDAFMFCTKNPLPLIPHLEEIDRPILMDVTVTPYHRDLEPNVPDKNTIIEGIRTISSILGREQVTVRYDPILISARYTVDYHLRAFEKLCTRLEGQIDSITVSFLDDYKNVRRNRAQIGALPLEGDELRRLGKGLADSARAHGIPLFACCEPDLPPDFPITPGACFSQKKAFTMTHKAFGKWKARDCGCVEMADIGAYNTCRHLCRYCYANYDEKQIECNCAQHDPHSSLLIGHLQSGDRVHRRLK